MRLPAGTADKAIQQQANYIELFSPFFTEQDYKSKFMMAGIYVHIPFCRKACHYCNFHFSTGTGNMQQMMDAICKEAEMRSGYINENISTIYFGGGTPSLLSPAQLQQILHCLHTNFNTADAVELTLEANPDDITKEALQQWKVAGINRLSIGVQSFFDDDLAWMNRAHNAKQSFESIELAQAAGFSNITIDIIYGTHTLIDEKLQENLHKAFHFNIPHLSCYALTVETGTALHKMIAQKKLPATDDEKQSRQFLQLMQAMQDAGYEHYEISNFAKPGM
ncbi:MAG TPA: radical SAM family heme chaperone HemW, partial [Chitinophagaceae bacterium]|nr:radical SAM family heme chaperone HemW [Chitinophagaceae bacterium]